MEVISQVMSVPLTAQNRITFDKATRPECPAAAMAVKTILALSRPRPGGLVGGPGDPNKFPFLVLDGTGITGRNKDVLLEAFQFFLDSNKNTACMMVSPSSGIQASGKSHNALQKLEMVFGEKRDAILDALRPGSDEEVEEGGGQAGLFTLLCEKWDETIQEYGIDAKSLVTSTSTDTPGRTSRSPTAAFAAAKTPKTKNSNFFSVTPAKKSASLHATSILGDADLCGYVGSFLGGERVS